MGTGPSVLLVEDEALVAWDLALQLEEMGVRVVGPFHALDEALTAAGSESYDAAMLDINLGKERVWPLADYLHARGYPLLFISADFDPAAIAASYPTARTLAKPIDRGAVRPFIESLSIEA